MRRFRPLGLLLVIAALLLTSISFLTRSMPSTNVFTRSASRLVATPNVIYLPHVANSGSKNAISQTGVISDGISLPSDWKATEPEQMETPEPIPNEVINTPVLYMPAPTPDLSILTSAALDSIVFTNPRLLGIPVEKQPTFGLIAWSPDSSRFIGTLLSDAVIQFGDQGRIISDLYLGDRESGELKLWQPNGGWPYWSEDGQSIYYLSAYGDDNGLHFDLYQRAWDSQSEDAILVARDVTAPTLAQPAVTEFANQSLLTLNRANKLTLLQARNQQLNGAKVSGAEELTQQHDFALMVPEISSLQSADYNLSFSVSPDNKTLALISVNQSMLLVNSSDFVVIDTIRDTAFYYRNLTWAADSQHFAYTNGNAAYLYDLQTKSATPLLTKAELGLRTDDNQSGINQPLWSPNQQVVLLSAFSSDWLPSDGTGESHFKNYIFAVTRDGKNKKAISTYTMNSMSPDSSSAIVEQWNSERQQYEKFLVDVTWQ
ncbi:MAG: hypothetical protein DYG89_44410 [Caldilinea sp. CFX5]|nr:hypothetical protein [Caldilinea sp. CFX5]